MTKKVFVHGVPDTPLIWRPLLDELGAACDATTLQLPGFGVGAPTGFTHDADAYAAWLEQSLRDLARSGPIDLVGHDWGGVLAWRMASVCPEILRSWTIICAPVWPAYRWHFFARLWQTPWLGEASMAVMRKPMVPPFLRFWKMPRALAKAEAAHADATMKRSILALYRSGRSIGARWAAGEEFNAKNGMFVFAKNDPFMRASDARGFADQLGVRFEEIDAGHWLIAETPDVISERLGTFWAAL